MRAGQKHFNSLNRMGLYFVIIPFIGTAQYELGRSLIYGRGCITDKPKGLDWLIRSAATGYVSAKLLLGIKAAEMSDLNSHQRAIEYFSEVEKLTPAAKLSYAWLLAKLPYEEIANPEKALDVIDDLSKYNFRDDVTIYEIKAAVLSQISVYDSISTF